MAGGIDWFRWHHGSVTDPKFQLVARKAGASLPDVLAVWAYLLEQASANADRGSFGCVDAEALDCLFGFPSTETRTAGVMEAMESRGLIADGRIVAWEKRQPKREREDNSTARVQAHRERHETPRNASGDQKTPREEKSREEKINTEAIASVGAKRATRKCPESFVVTDELREWAAREVPGVDIERETAKLRDHTYRAARSDWDGAWRNWMRGAADNGPRRPQAAQNKHAAAAAAIFGTSHPQGEYIDV